MYHQPPVDASPLYGQNRRRCWLLLDGTIVSVPVDEGQTVNANQTTPTIVQIADLDKMEIKIEISEGDITAVKPGMPITYTILSNPETEYKATLTSIDPGLTTLTDGSYKTTSSTGMLRQRSSTSIVQYSFGTKASISCSRSTTRRVATDCTRPADRPRRIFFHSSGLSW